MNHTPVLFVRGLICGHQGLWVPKKDLKLADMSLKKLHADCEHGRFRLQAATDKPLCKCLRIVVLCAFI
ncbi:hypothetical protein ALO38_101109 [Pseudomonas coronafaciens pv. zizaniae]|nr:hypothetical protein ALO38_101109 [Pseudomonas coronafaciens pv. zizaniae]